MKYYTGRGDNGKTDVFGKRVYKNSNVIEAIGDIDELNAFLGYGYSMIEDKNAKRTIKTIENNLYKISAKIAGYKSDFDKKDLDDLEKEVQDYSAKVKDVRKFLYPNGSTPATVMNIARTVCRRAERHAEKSTTDSTILAYLNRLSTLLFLLFRYLNKNEETIN